MPTLQELIEANPDANIEDLLQHADDSSDLAERNPAWLSAYISKDDKGNSSFNVSRDMPGEQQSSQPWHVPIQRDLDALRSKPIQNNPLAKAIMARKRMKQSMPSVQEDYGNDWDEPSSINSDQTEPEILRDSSAIVPPAIPKTDQGNRDAIINTIKRRLAWSNEDSDPLVEYLSGDNGLEKDRQKMMEISGLDNIGLAMDSFAIGADKPEQNKLLYQNLHDENKNLLSQKGLDEDRRVKVLQAIQTRKGLQSKYDKDKQIQDNRDREFAFKKDRFAAGLDKELREESIVKIGNQNLAALKKGISLIKNTRVALNNTNMHDIETDLASALTFKASAITEGRIDRATIDTLRRRWQSFTANVTSIPNFDLRKHDPGLVKQVYDTLLALKQDYNDELLYRLQDNVESKSKLITDPDLLKRLQSIPDSFKSRLEREESRNPSPPNPPNKTVLKTFKSNDGRYLKHVYADGTEEIFNAW